MEKFDLFKDFAERTNGDIYIGVVGPVRTGKSTFIKKFMELLVLPNIENPHDKMRAKDELPQSGAGRTITTAEPKFIPNEAIELTVDDKLKFKVRIVDCVGYTVKGALGYQDENGPRMVSTPWFDHEIPFQEAAELGTRKVISDHSTIGIVITTDGSITDISREEYVEAEERVIKELIELGKPFIIVLNSTDPQSETAQKIKNELEENYDIAVVTVNCAKMKEQDVYHILKKVLYEFMLQEINVEFPKWVDVLADEHWLKIQFVSAVRDTLGNIRKLRDVEKAVQKFKDYEFVSMADILEMDLGKGVTKITLQAKAELFYKILSEITGFEIRGDHHLMKTIGELATAKREYDKIKDALEKVKQIGYGIVPPRLEDMTLDEPEIIRQGGRFGVRLRASAPSIHMIKAEIQTEVSPIVGTEKQSEELVNYLLREFESDTKKIWETNIFGKSLNELVREGLQNKLAHMPEAAQMKLKETLERIINEGSGGLICIIL